MGKYIYNKKIYSPCIFQVWNMEFLNLLVHNYCKKTNILASERRYSMRKPYIVGSYKEPKDLWIVYEGELLPLQEVQKRIMAEK